VSRPGPAAITLFLCGDVMTGRGIDQVLPHPGRPELFEPVVRSATEYVRLAERVTGPIPRPVDFAYVWGDALGELARRGPHARIVNVETAVTTSADPWPGKAVHYRMHPANAPCLEAARIDCGTLANNHVLDWGARGLVETLETLHRTGIRTAGAGRDAREAAAPATLELPGRGRVLVFALASGSSGAPAAWAAHAGGPGISRLDELSADAARAIASRVGAVRRPGDLVVVSVHWGGNWGFEIPPEQRAFARGLIDAGAADVVHGHSSHHVKGIEVHRDRPILYGCGDFLTDYEGIGGHEAFRGDLGLMYFPALEAAGGRLLRLDLVPTRVRHFRVERASAADARWLAAVLAREGAALGTGIEAQPDGSFRLTWR
jgi:poly-gamma-glutamate synthesis protein (capsule biosynthesis protein)